MLSTNKVPLFLLGRPLGAADIRRYDRELAVLQGNILKSHGREATASVFLTFKPGKRWIAKGSGTGPCPGGASPEGSFVD